MGSKILFLRIFALVSVIVGIYAIYWFLFSRISQITTPTSIYNESEINSPRLNKKEVSDFLLLLEERKIYSGSEAIEKSFEENPFQE